MNIKTSKARRFSAAYYELSTNSKSTHSIIDNQETKVCLILNIFRIASLLVHPKCAELS